jgi:hypothetical protein
MESAFLCNECIAKQDKISPKEREKRKQWGRGREHFPFGMEQVHCKIGENLTPQEEGEEGGGGEEEEEHYATSAVQNRGKPCPKKSAGKWKRITKMKITYLPHLHCKNYILHFPVPLSILSSIFFSLSP